MSLEIVHAGSVDIVRLSGFIDGKTAPAISTALMPALDGPNDIVLDLTGVAYVSSAGLRLLLVAYRKVHDASRRLVLVGVSTDIRQVMSHTGFLAFFVFAPNEAEALATLGAPQ